MADTLIQEITEETLSVTSTGETVVLNITHSEILEGGSIGPPGPAGPQGPPGTGTAVPWQEDVFSLGGNQTVFTLSSTPAASTISLFINGLRQTNDNFSVVGTTLTVTGFTPTTGDTVDIVYQ